jgi:hypothetical protein
MFCLHKTKNFNFNLRLPSTFESLVIHKDGLNKSSSFEALSVQCVMATR